MSSIRLITFDLDDTFWYAAPTIDRAETVLQHWLAEHVPQIGDFTREVLAQLRQQVLSQQPELSHRVSTLRRKVLDQAFNEAGYEADQRAQVVERAFQVFLEARHAVEVFPEVRPVLESLQGRYQLGVLTNGNADVHRLGLGDYFQFALSAEELGIGKPDRRPFSEALQRAGVQPTEAVHIGDHPIDDIQGARQAGVRSIWFNPSGQPWQQGLPPDAQVQSLAEVPALIDRWAAEQR